MFFPNQVRIISISKGEKLRMEENIYFKILELFGNKGRHFTTEDLARELGTSKRTIYTHFASKNEMIDKTIDFVFSEIMKYDNSILESNEYSFHEKVEMFFHNIPDTYNISAIIRHSDDLQKYYPESWKKLNNYLNNLWDGVIQLIESKKEQAKKVNTVILRLILTETLRKLLDYEFVAKNQISFESGSKAIYDIVLYGIIK
ncbi:division inhibitor protein [compost metagenome]